MRKFVYLFGFLFLFAACQQEEQIESLDNAQEISIENEVELTEKLQALNEIILTKGRNLYDLGHGFYATKGVVPTDSILSDAEKQAFVAALQPIVSATKEVLSLYGISEVELEDIFGNANDERIALVGIALVGMQENENALTRAETVDYMNCAAKALGFNLFSSLRNLSKKAVLAVVKEVAKRMSGVAGVAITVGEFVWCLNS